jgi:hypothetical protein
MRNTFNPKEYLQGLSVDLVNAFDKAGQTTHPGAVGSGREKSVRDQLQRVLPSGVGVGSGFVIDSYGNTSAQCDIIIYERDLALKFAPNDDDLYVFFNCECVIAVGQVKSDASLSEVRASIRNLKSVRELTRLQQYSREKSLCPNSSCFRRYLSVMSIEGAIDEQYNPILKSSDQIFTFMICKSLKTVTQSILQALNEEAKEKKFFPNRFLSTDNQYGFWLHRSSDSNATVSFSAIDGNSFTVQRVDCALGQLVMELIAFINSGRTVPLNNAAYLLNLKDLPLSEPVYPLEPTEESNR